MIRNNKNSTLNDIDSFLKYNQINYIYGTPGSGKTSSICSTITQKNKNISLIITLELNFSRLIERKVKNILENRKKRVFNLNFRYSKDSVFSNEYIILICSIDAIDNFFYLFNNRNIELDFLFIDEFKQSIEKSILYNKIEQLLKIINLSKTSIIADLIKIDLNLFDKKINYIFFKKSITEIVNINIKNKIEDFYKLFTNNDNNYYYIWGDDKLRCDNIYLFISKLYGEENIQYIKIENNRDIIKFDHKKKIILSDSRIKSSLSILDFDNKKRKTILLYDGILSCTDSINGASRVRNCEELIIFDFTNNTITNNNIICKSDDINHINLITYLNDYNKQGFEKTLKNINLKI